MKRAVITGPTGAIGMALITQCIREGWEVLGCLPQRVSQNKQYSCASACEGTGDGTVRIGAAGAGYRRQI